MTSCKFTNKFIVSACCFVLKMNVSWKMFLKRKTATTTKKKQNKGKLGCTVPVPWPPLAPSSWPAAPAHKHLGSGFSGTPSPAPPAARSWRWSGASSSCCWTRCCRTCPPRPPARSFPGRSWPETPAGSSSCRWTSRDPSAGSPRPFSVRRNWLIGEKIIILYYIVLTKI